MEERTYASAMQELETIVEKMQHDDCDIDSLAAYTKKALELLKFCREKLFKTDEEIKLCLQELMKNQG